MTEIVREHRFRRFVLVCLCVGALGIFVALMSIRFGSLPLSTEQVTTVFWDRLHGKAPSDPLADEIVWELRFPRVATAALVGIALSISGATLQTLVRNPVADPYILGTGPGASMGAIIVMLTPGATVLAKVGVPLGAFIGAMGALLAVMILGQRQGTLSPTRMVLAGVAIGYLCNAFSSYLQLRANPVRLNGVLHWLLGSFGGSDWDGLLIPSVLITASTLVILFQIRGMNAMLFGEDTARHLGVNVRALRMLLLVLSSILTGAAVSLAGGVAFIGLLVPHIGRLLVGAVHERLLPFCILAGALLMVGVDLISRTINAPSEMPVSIFTAILGVPFFLWLLRKDK